ncbi:hypothetical protein AAE478_005278 [Parahypoxylon ruwenzoriense]
MPRTNPDHDFDIYVDRSYPSSPMSDDSPRYQTFEEADVSSLSGQESNIANDIDIEEYIARESLAVELEEDEVKMVSDSEVRQSIERDHHGNMDNGGGASRPSSRRPSEGTESLMEAMAHADEKRDDLGDSSSVSERSDDSHENSGSAESHFPHATTTTLDDGGDNSSHHEATDEDVFSDKSPRSSMGSFDSIPESRKARRETDNMTTVCRSPRISDISQYDREEFAPTARGTPRPPFRTPSDVRAIHMSSPTPSVLGSPRSTRKQFPTVSRLGTPTASAQYSPKRMSTPPRFKGRKEAPLVLLHVTLLPLRWVWGDLLNNLDTEELSEQTKKLRDSWRILQDRIGDTVIERGILLGHPQNDYEVLEERLLEALELPLRRRARILECGHYLGPANETFLGEDEESEDEHSSYDRTRAIDKRHWCGTCKNEIRYDSLGTGKIFRVKVYASNGLMKAGAWAACWKEMERVDVELEPIVEPTVQEELVRLAAARQERELSHQEEAEIAKEVAQQMREQHQKEQEDLLHARAEPASPQLDPEPDRAPSSAEERRWRDEERLREIYGHTPPPQEHQSREPSVPPHPESYRPSSSPSPRSPSRESFERKEPQNHSYKNATLPELLMQSIRVLMRDRKNILIFVLSVFVLMLAFRNAPSPPEPTYEPVIHRMRDGPIVRRATIVETAQGPTVQVRISTVVPHAAESVVPNYQEPVVIRHDTSVPSYQDDTKETPEAEPIVAPPAYQETSEEIFQEERPQEQMPEEPTHMVECTQAVPEYQEPAAESTAAAPSYEESLEAIPQPTPAQEAETAVASVSTVYEPCNMSLDWGGKPSAAASQSEETEFVMEKKVVRVVHTVTETEVETATVKVTSTEVMQQPEPSVTVEDRCAEESTPASPPEPEEPVAAEAATEAVMEAATEATVEASEVASEEPATEE